MTTRRMHLPPPILCPRDSTLESCTHCLTCRREAESSANAYLTTNAEGAPVCPQAERSGPPRSAQAGPASLGTAAHSRQTPSRQHCQNMPQGTPPSTGIAERRLSQTPYRVCSRWTDTLSGVSAFHPRALLQANHRKNVAKGKDHEIEMHLYYVQDGGRGGTLGGSIWTGEVEW